MATQETEAEGKYKALQDGKPQPKVEPNSRRHLCKFMAGSEENLTEHLMVNHVFDLKN